MVPLKRGKREECLEPTSRLSGEGGCARQKEKISQKSHHQQICLFSVIVGDQHSYQGAASCGVYTLCICSPAHHVSAKKARKSVGRSDVDSYWSTPKFWVEEVVVSL